MAMSESSKSRYILYGYDISYFTGKVEAYMKYRGIAYTLIQPTRRFLVERILPATGKMKVPVLHDRKEDKWLHDSTSTIEYLDSDASGVGSGPKVVPLEENQVHRFFSFLLEDYADESLWRPALYYRWNFEKDRQLNAARFRSEFLYDIRAPDFLVHRTVIRRQIGEYVYGDGIRDDATRELTERMYLDTLDVLEGHFSKTPFLLGNLPTLSDFGFFASHFRHFSLDPTPSLIMRSRAPSVYEWVARMWNARKLVDGPSTISFKPCVPSDEIPESWYTILKHAGKWYLPYLHANAIAFRDGKTEFDWGPAGEKAVYKGLPVVQFRVWCREKLQARLEAVPTEPARDKILAILKQTGCLPSLQADGVIASNLEDADLLPFYRAREIPTRKTFAGWLLGFEPPVLGGKGRRMPWNEEVYPIKDGAKAKL
jgi:glutathione S-transferase